MTGLYDFLQIKNACVTAASVDRDGQQQQHIIKFGVAEIMWQIYRQPFEINKPGRKDLTKTCFSGRGELGIYIKKLFPQNIESQYFEEIIFQLAAADQALNYCEIIFCN